MAQPPRQAPVHDWMRHAAALALAATERESADGESHAMSALIHTALMMETFFEFLGAHIDRDWSTKGRRFSKYKRLRVFRLALGIDDDINARPWRSVADAFDFHDMLVSGRIDGDEKREALALSEDEMAAQAIGEDWRDFCSVDNARRVFEDVEAVITELGRAAGLAEPCAEHGKD